jgi:hypothetical protein
MPHEVVQSRLDSSNWMRVVNNLKMVREDIFERFKKVDGLLCFGF